MIGSNYSETGLRICSICGEAKEPIDFVKQQSNWDGLSSWCKKCKNASDKERRRNSLEEYKTKKALYYKRHRDKIKEYQRKCAHSENGIIANRERTRRYYHQNIEKSKARVLLRTHVFEGKIQKPYSCEVCGIGGIRISGHHYRGYSNENKLRVIWLCDKCHFEAEHKLIQLGCLQE